jgi:hypothetical protein
MFIMHVEQNLNMKTNISSPPQANQSDQVRINEKGYLQDVADQQA